MSATTTFVVTLHQLAPDLKQAGTQFPDLERTGVTPDLLRGWLELLAVLAPAVEYPVTPELRVTGPAGRFLVQARGGQVRVTSWSSNAGGAGLTPSRVLALIMGADPVAVGSPEVAPPGDGNRGSRGMKIAVMIAAILGANALTAWMLMRPPPRLPAGIVPEYKLVEAESARRILADFAGEFETGVAEGDRNLIIGPDGDVRWIRFGPNRSIAEETALKVQAAESNGRPVLVADNHGVMEMKDAITVVYFREQYRRKAK